MTTADNYGTSMRDKIKVLSELNAALECEELTSTITGRPSGELLYEVFKRSVLKEIESIFSTQGSAHSSEKVSKAIDGLDEILNKIDSIKTKVVSGDAPQMTSVENYTTAQTTTHEPVAQVSPTTAPAPKRVASFQIKGFTPFS